MTFLNIKKNKNIRIILRRRHSTDSGTVFLHTIFHTNVCNQLFRKQPKLTKFLKNAQNFNLKPFLESALVTESKTVFGFSCLAPEVLFMGTQKCVKSNLWVLKKWYIWR